MNLIDRLAYYPDPSDRVLHRKFSSQEALPTQPCYEPAIAKIQNRFASQTLEENGHKLTSADRMQKLTDTYRSSELPTSAPETSRTNIGKVRQLFEERRKQIRRPAPTALTSRSTAVGRDKSYPLQPIRRRKPQEDNTGDDNSVEPEPELTQPIIYDCSIFGKLPNLGGRLLSEKKIGTESETKNYFTHGEMSAGSHRTIPSVTKITEGVSRLGIRQNGVQKKPQSRTSIPSPQQRNVPLIKKPTRTSNGVNNISSPKNANNTNNSDQKKTTIQSSPIKSVPIKKPIVNGTPPQTQKTKPATVKTTPPPGMSSCKVCGRHFATDRVQLHQQICEKASKKKRKAYDPIKHRLKGTEAEGMINQIKTKIKAPPAQPAKKGNWRKQHEEFLNNIRAARMVKQHLAGGGKLSDLPPPPPLDTSDYVPCPHCGRKFNEAAAERHIPKCVNIKHNKPKNNIPVARTGQSKLPSNKVNMTRKR